MKRYHVVTIVALLIGIMGIACSNDDNPIVPGDSDMMTL